MLDVAGDPDENVFVVQNGRVNVFITGSEGEQISLKVVKTGDSVTSLLSFTDVLTVILIFKSLNSLVLSFFIYRTPLTGRV